jgi:polyvinyl alcohol dehydrogenase (cytochrome)
MRGDPSQGGAGGVPSMPAAGSGDAPEVTGDPDAWINFGGNLEQTFAPISTILNESNLMRVGLAAWSGEAAGGVTGTPAVYKGVVYWADWVGNVYAQNVTDGIAQWNPPVKLEHGVTSSPAVTERLVYLADRFNTVHALDRASGQEIWKNVVSDSPMAQLWSSPVVADGVLIVGIGCKGTADGTSGAFSPADLMMFRGAVVGLDAETGELRWRWENTIDAATGTMYGPGVSSWSSAAVDTTRKIAYIGTGNSYYPEASPYSDSLLALRYLTTNRKGELAWHAQFTMNDNYTTGNPTAGPDYDVGATPNLFSIGGRDFVAVGDKGGRFYILDRETHQITFNKMFGKGSNRGGVMAPAAYAQGTLYLTSNEGSNTVLAAVDASQNTLTWERRLMGVSYGAPVELHT